MPKVGEYWYIVMDTTLYPLSNKTEIGKIVAIDMDYVVIKYINKPPQYSNTITVEFSKLFHPIKWKPSLFLRLLGYK